MTSIAAVSAPVTQPAELLARIASVPRIVFDLDGTLYDTRDFERPALAAVADWLRQESGRRLQGLTQALWLRRETDRHRPGLFDDLLSRYDLPQSWGGECARRFHDYPALELRHAHSLREHLHALRSAHCRLALVSNGHQELQHRKLVRLGLSDMFDVCVYCDPIELDRLKPSAWAWGELAAWRSSLPAVYVGDDAVDAEFSIAAGVPFVGFCFRSSVYGD